MGSTIYLALTGPAPHEPEDCRVVSFDPDSDSVKLEASGAGIRVAATSRPSPSL